jgi:hypothetical protein
VPDNGTSSVGFGASDVIVRLPAALPADCGAKVSVKLVPWPPARVTGSVSPLKLKPVPLAVACEIVTLAPPVLVRVAACCWLLPTATLPKSTLAGFIVSEPGAMPVPDKDMERAPLEALLVIEIVPLTLPVEEGVKTIFRLALWPAETVSGKVCPLKENCGTLNVPPVIVTAAVPLFVAVTGSVLLLPTTTLPKFSEEWLNPRSPLGAGCWFDELLPLTP